MCNDCKKDNIKNILQSEVANYSNKVHDEYYNESVIPLTNENIEQIIVNPKKYFKVKA